MELLTAIFTCAVAAVLVKALVSWVVGHPAELTGKTIFITGCDSGYGYSLALQCQEWGMKVIAGCFVNGEGRRELEVKGVKVVDLDLTSQESIEQAMDSVKKECGEPGLNYLVNNAASLIFGEGAWLTSQQVETIFRINTLGPIQVVKLGIPLLHSAKGRIINIVSNCTYCPLPSLSVYTSSKAALSTFSHAIRPEVAKYDIKVVLVNPGDAPTETNICTGQAAHFKSMEAILSPAERRLYRGYFYRCKEKFVGFNPDPPKLNRTSNPNYYATMKRALTAEKPRVFYENIDLGSWLFFLVVGILPYSISDNIRLAIMKLPKYPTYK